jgi:ketosteroid isomerase-like protein
MDNGQSSSQDEVAIRDMVESWTAAVRRRDFEGVLQNHSSDIAMFDVPPPFQSQGIEPTYINVSWTDIFARLNGELAG